MEATRGYIKSLDGVRAIAILLVMTFHANLTEFGWVGVQLFFVLSGYLITGILWKDKSNPGSLGSKFKKFWIRRSLRIFPLYYGFLLLIALLYFTVHFPAYFNTYFPFAASYTINFMLAFIQTPGNPIFHHLWSLSIEEQFYLLFPLIILLSPPRLIKFLLIAIIFLSPVIRFALGEYYNNKGFSPLIVSNAVNFNTLCQLDAFCIGGLISIFSLSTKIKKPIRLLGIAAVIALVAGLASYLTGPKSTPYIMDLGYFHYLIGNYQYVWQYTCLNFVFAALILALVSVHTANSLKPLRRFLENKWMVNIGKVSYGMYIFHWMVWVYGFGHFFNIESMKMKLLLFIPYVIAVYLVSAISFRFFESGFIRLKDKWAPSKAA